MALMRLTASCRFLVACAAVLVLGGDTQRVATAPQMGGLAIVGGTLIDGTGAGARPGLDIEIREGRIASIRPRGSGPLPADLEVIRAEGRFVVPGLIDAHIHYRDYYPELLLTHGITGVLDWGGSPVEWILAQKEGIRKGKIFGPRIYTCGDMVEEDAPDAAVREVRVLADRQADHICIGFTPEPPVIAAVAREAKRLGLPLSGYPVHTRQAIDAGIGAIKHTYTVGSANVNAPAALKELYRQGSLPGRSRDARLFLLGDDHKALAELMAARRVVWVPTLAKDFKVIHDRRDEFELQSLRLLAHPELQYLPVENLIAQLTNQFETGLPVIASGRVGTIDRDSADFQTYRRSYAALQHFLRTLVQAGGRVLAGTAPHSFVLPGLSLHQEMQLFVDAGLTPMQALQSASSWVAEYIGVAGEVGTIQEGKRADLLILSGNPLEDIRNSTAIETVIQDGRVQPIGYHRSYANPIPRNTARDAPGAGNPRPHLESVAPLVVVEGAGDLPVTLRGSAFVPGAVARFDGVPLVTTFVSASELSAVVPARLLRSVGTYWFSVFNPRPGGGESPLASLIVKYR